MLLFIAQVAHKLHMSRQCNNSRCMAIKIPPALICKLLLTCWITDYLHTAEVLMLHF